ncbi:hypothetical protein A3860_35445 [Niastella vici]|uniref:Uncharacterized protein n=1 Tax=Niastella vici TaxID=1703345 RepID=A0A1V9FNM3_9BACT|nr:hypothetical protein A3860_35445 [Niastella vici]
MHKYPHFVASYQVINDMKWTGACRVEEGVLGNEDGWLGVLVGLLIIGRLIANVLLCCFRLAVCLTGWG